MKLLGFIKYNSKLPIGPIDLVSRYTNIQLFAHFLEHANQVVEWGALRMIVFQAALHDQIKRRRIWNISGLFTSSTHV